MQYMRDKNISGGNVIESTRKATEVAQLMIRSEYLLIKSYANFCMLLIYMYTGFRF